MEKGIKDFANGFLNYSSVWLFFLFAMKSFNWYNSADLFPTIVTIVVSYIGTICFLAWIYAIVQKANELLQTQNIFIEIFNFFNVGLIVMFFAGLIMLYEAKIKGTTDAEFRSGGWYFTYSRPGEILLISIGASCFSLFVVAKMLVSAELQREAEFKEYYITFFLLLIPSYIGVWFLQPRVKRLNVQPVNEEYEIESEDTFS